MQMWQWTSGSPAGNMRFVNQAKQAGQHLRSDPSSATGSQSKQQSEPARKHQRLVSHLWQPGQCRRSAGPLGESHCAGGLGEGPPSMPAIRAAPSSGDSAEIRALWLAAVVTAGVAGGCEAALPAGKVLAVAEGSTGGSAAGAGAASAALAGLAVRAISCYLAS